MEKILLLLLLKEQAVFENKYLLLLNVKTKQEYTKNVFLKKQNKLTLSLCKEEIRLQYIPTSCWKLEKQWTKHSKIKSSTKSKTKSKTKSQIKKSILSLLGKLCAKNVTLIKDEKDLLKIDLKTLPAVCAKNVKYTLKTILYRKNI
ncbi:MAG: hypothetical protein HAW60_03690 [Bdellovibrionales bacterium]|nr:hypothetical protein [Bdellovibrionales bacterium]